MAGLIFLKRRQIAALACAYKKSGRRRRRGMAKLMTPFTPPATP
jgi:hypothetical protein